MKKIAVFSDVHGNIEALKAIYLDILLEGISEVYHLGDAIAIGPEPKATLDFIIDKEIISLKGNHEIYYTDIINTGLADVHEGELIHQR
jgi:predicted phosphodiesterase